MNIRQLRTIALLECRCWFYNSACFLLLSSSSSSSSLHYFIYYYLNQLIKRSFACSAEPFVRHIFAWIIFRFVGIDLCIVYVQTCTEWIHLIRYAKRDPSAITGWTLNSSRMVQLHLHTKDNAMERWEKNQLVENYSEMRFFLSCFHAYESHIIAQ